MRVSVQYAGSHLTEAIEADAPVRSDAAHSKSMTKRGLWGAGKGEIWMAEDWDSPETNDTESVAQAGYCRSEMGAPFSIGYCGSALGSAASSGSSSYSIKSRNV